MAFFRYTAVDRAGRTIHGRREAENAHAVVEWLQRQGHIPLRAEPADSWLGRLAAIEPGRRPGLRKAEVAALIRELGIMLGAGQDLDRALRFLTETAASPALKSVAADLRERVRGGASLAQALAQHPGSFSELHIGLVRAGEAGGSLGDSLDRLGQLLERDRALAAQIQSALLYPALLVIAAAGSITLLLTYVLPQFVPFFTQSGVPLPLSTRILLSTGDLVAAGGPWVALLGLAAILCLPRFFQDEGRRRRRDRWLLRLPVAGSLLREIVAARFARTLGMLLRNGVPLVAALGIVERALGNREARAAVADAESKVRTGAGLAAALESARLFPLRTIHLLRLGEETAQLAAMALRAAEIHETQVRSRLERLVALLVPAITVAMGLVVAGIVASLLTAMLSLNDLVM